WIIQEYSIAEEDRSALKKNNNLRLDDWVLCRIYNKKGSLEKQNVVVEQTQAESPELFEEKPVILPQGGALPPPPVPEAGMFNELAYLDTSDSVPRLHTDSSCSEHVLSPEFTCEREREVQSEPTKLMDWEKAALEYPFNYVDATMDSTFTSPLQDMFKYLQKPF
ncbi:hypothetical protein ACR8KM_22590, partial [Salmonella enterica subsp. enterica serovar Paratyphi A]